MKLSIKAFSISMGLVCGFIVFIGTWWLIVQGKFLGDSVFLSDIYPFYKVSPLGSIWGLICGFVDGLILGGIFAWLYNLLSRKNN